MLRENWCVQSVDLRDILKISPQSLSDVYAKVGTSFLQTSKAQERGKIKYITGPEMKKILQYRGFSFERKSEVISFMMCKGGVGKTTSSFFIALRLSAFGFRVLAVDTDAQGNLTSSFGLEDYGFSVEPETPVLADVISGECNLSDTVIEVSDNLHLIPSTPMNANLDSKIRERVKNVSLAYSKHFGSIRKSYDYIIMDCAPALNLANTAALCVSDRVVMPVSPDKFSQLGLQQTIDEIEQIEQDFGVMVDKKILFTKYDAREFLSYKYLAEIVQKFEKKRFNTAIRTSTDLKNSIAQRKDLFSLRRSNGKFDYDQLSQEIAGLDVFFRAKKPKDNQPKARN